MLFAQTHIHVFQLNVPENAWQYEQAIIHIVLLPTSFRWEKKHKRNRKQILAYFIVYSDLIEFDEFA